MYSLIVVDDEEIIREGISCFVPWNDMDYKVVACFEDGKEAIEYLKSNQVDIVLTDIRMLEISGLEIAKYVYESELDTKVVIISGYQDFEYAKKAIEYNVKNYILKPTDYQEIIKVFTVIKKELDRQRQKKACEQKEKEYMDEIIQMVKEQFYYDLVVGGLRDKQDIEKRIQRLNLYIEPSNTRCCLVDMKIENYEKYLKEKWQYEKERFTVAIRNYIHNQEYDNINYVYVYSHFDRFTILAMSSRFSDNETMTAEVISQLTEMKVSLNEILGTSTIFEIQEVYNNLLELARRRELFQFNISKNYSAKSNKLKEKAGLLVSYLRQKNFEEAINMFDNFIDNIGELPIGKVHSLTIELFQIISDKLFQIDKSYTNFIQENLNYGLITETKEIEYIRRLGENILKDIEKYERNENGDEALDDVIRTVKEYIEQNYARDISMEDMAERVFFSPVYFSRFFKQHTGENFTDYLIKVRMKYACILLKENKYKVYEISEKVGYKTCRYFIKLFKQYTGYTPKDYQKNILKVEWI